MPPSLQSTRLTCSLTQTRENRANKHTDPPAAAAICLAQPRPLTVYTHSQQQASKLPSDKPIHTKRPNNPTDETLVTVSVLILTIFIYSRLPEEAVELFKCHQVIPCLDYLLSLTGGQRNARPPLPSPIKMPVCQCWPPLIPTEQTLHNYKRCQTHSYPVVSASHRERVPPTVGSLRGLM